MSKRRNKKSATPARKTGGKKLRWSWGSIIAILLAVLFLASMVFTTPGGFNPIANSNTSNNNVSSSRTNPIGEPAFKKEGELIFRSGDKVAQQIDIEIVDQPAEIQQGLMYRTKMAETQGMLFVFPEEKPQSFWMRNTFISLDIIYVNSQKEVVSIQKYTTPKSEESLPSEAPAQFVIEVNAGFCDRYGIAKGTRVEF